MQLSTTWRAQRTCFDLSSLSKGNTSQHLLNAFECTLFRAISKWVRRTFQGWEIPLITLTWCYWQMPTAVQHWWPEVLSATVSINVAVSVLNRWTFFISANCTGVFFVSPRCLTPRGRLRWNNTAPTAQFWFYYLVWNHLSTLGWTLQKLLGCICVLDDTQLLLIRDPRWMQNSAICLHKPCDARKQHLIESC